MEPSTDKEITMGYRTIAAAVLATTLALAAGAAGAQTRDNDRGGNNGRLGNPEGLYLGLGIGDFSTRLDSDITNIDANDLDFNSNDDALKAFVGWRFNRFFAVQLDYTDFGRTNAQLAAGNISADTKGVTPSVVGTLPLGPVELFVRGGMIFYDLKVNSNTSNLVDDSGHDPVFGAGIGLTVAKRLNLRAEYERIEINNLNDANAVWLSAAWRF
jgi:hypothetical protein